MFYVFEIFEMYRLYLIFFGENNIIEFVKKRHIYIQF